ncbi:autophagy protein 5 [Apophysomyces ossiformis]|uniref:Autophagy protein 5 n=1 Tax=Apophysomyces ossiformis TaxID=679940 RepID=A0A8H7BQF0_9FUNG|nr:autophagy protein 5 [Apophysomyces ossiformis]
MSRCSYLPLLAQQLSSVLDATVEPGDIWFDFRGEPLRWHYPIGILYDLHSLQDSKVNSPLPWSLTVHTQNFPTEKLLRRPSMETVQDMFMSMIKEVQYSVLPETDYNSDEYVKEKADFLRHGTTKRVMNLSKRDQTQLWESVASDKFDDYWNVNKRLLETTASQPLRNIPLRLYLPEQCPVIQELVPADEIVSDPARSLGEVVSKILPDLFSPTLTENIAIPVIHGISLPLDTPIIWAAENLSFADNFLHIVISKA